LRRPGQAERHLEGSLAEQPLHLLHAVVLACADGGPGGEADLLVRTPSGQSFPVTVWRELDGSVVVEGGSPLVWPLPPSAGALRSSFDLGELREEAGARWDDRALLALQAAVSLLSGPERAVLGRQPLIRLPLSSDASQAARHESHGCEQRILVFDRAFLGTAVEFVGSASSPRPAAAMPIVHEIGHAIHKLPLVRASCDQAARVRAYNAGVAAFNAEVRAYNDAIARGDQAAAQGLSSRLREAEVRLAAEQRQVEAGQARVAELAEEDGPVVDAYERVRDGVWGPTAYGNGEPAESFAEAFALWVLDRPALARIMPAVARWFEQGGHLHAAGL
jgi:hypothetical protein